LKSQRTKLAAELRGITRASGNKLLIANDADLAARLGADGIHLSEDRAGQAFHWRALHPRWIITAAAHNARTTCLPALDAVFLSPVFATQSHPERVPLGGIMLRCIAMLARAPVYALGGIDDRTVARLMDAPLIGLAAIGGLSAAGHQRRSPMPATDLKPPQRMSGFVKSL
ncbi:MAG TPA: thiamine phosphate synthase, partial [Nitrobacter sp.]|nr:thiamine phosphate synthase [Nitrobacter sp.]